MVYFLNYASVGWSVLCRLQGPNTLHGPFVVWIDLFLFTNLIYEMIICVFFFFHFFGDKKEKPNN